MTAPVDDTQGRARDGAPPPGSPGPPGADRDAGPVDTRGAAAELMERTLPAGMVDGDDHCRSGAGAASDASLPGDGPEDDRPQVLDAGAIEVLRRGLAVTPELRQGIVITLAMAAVLSAGKLAVPVLIQQILDRGVLGDNGFDPGFVYPACAVTAVFVMMLYVVGRSTYLRLIRAAEASLLALRVRLFDHIHKLSLAEHTDQRRGALVARVTSDIESLAQFMEWGAVAWIVDSVLIVATFLLMLVYDWRLALLTLVCFGPLPLVLPTLQRRQLAAQDQVRTAVGDSLSEVSETITGAAVIQAYGLEGRARTRLGAAIDRQYRSYLLAARYFAAIFPLGDLFGSLALAVVIGAGVTWGQGWGLEVGELVAFTFLIGLLLNPIAVLSEIIDQTQIAIAGWRKVLGVLATPLDVPEPADGVTLPRGPLEVHVERLGFAYRDGGPVLQDVDVRLPAGGTVAIVGETGSGKTTFAKLLCRLADPTEGTVRVAGVDLRGGGTRAAAPGGKAGAPGRVPVRRHDRRQRTGRRGRRGRRPRW